MKNEFFELLKLYENSYIDIRVDIDSNESNVTVYFGEYYISLGKLKYYEFIDSYDIINLVDDFFRKQGLRVCYCQLMILYAFVPNEKLELGLLIKSVELFRGE